MADRPTSGNDGFIGYVTEDGTSVTELACPTSGNELRQEGRFLYCNRSGVFTGEIGVGCIDDVWYYSSTSRSSASGSVSEFASTWIRTCGWGCMTATIYDDASPTAASRLLIGCENSFGLESTSYTAAYVQTTGGESMKPYTTSYTNIHSPSRSTAVSSTTSAATSTSTSSQPPPSRSSDPVDNGGGPNVGLIVGAVVGSVAGLALIIGLVILAYRMGRKRSNNNNNGGGEAQAGGLSNIPRPSIIWTRKGTPSNVPSQMGPPQNKEAVPMMAQTHIPSQELGTSHEHAGWAASQPQAYPQEMYAPAPTQRYG
ncbi:hypothetical protein S40293_02205 [Stachybotrys chartarum IBT 40293]|nr:hypothetical protein S40293_02205 [Stachybotrys chartarum IBT 40293]